MEARTTQVNVMSERAVADLLGVSPRTLQGWRLRGTGPAYRKLGRKRIVYMPEDLREYLDRARRTSTGGRGAAV